MTVFFFRENRFTSWNSWLLFLSCMKKKGDKADRSLFLKSPIDLNQSLPLELYNPVVLFIYFFLQKIAYSILFCVLRLLVLTYASLWNFTQHMHRTFFCIFNYYNCFWQSATTFSLIIWWIIYTRSHRRLYSY